MGKKKKEKFTKPITPTKSPSKKPGEGWTRKYAQISVDSIKSIAESNGMPISSDEVADVLAQDVSYRLRNVIQVRKQWILVIKTCPKQTNICLRSFAVIQKGLYYYLRNVRSRSRLYHRQVKASKPS